MQPASAAAAVNKSTRMTNIITRVVCNLLVFCRHRLEIYFVSWLLELTLLQTGGDWEKGGGEKKWRARGVLVELFLFSLSLSQPFSLTFEPIILL